MNANSQLVSAAQNMNSRNRRSPLAMRISDVGADISNATSREDWLRTADLGWTARMADVLYRTASDPRLMAVEDRKVIYRDDTGLDLGVTSDHFKMFQPDDVGYFFEDLCQRHGFVLDRAGTFKGGKVIFARAKVGNALRIHGNDIVEGTVSLVTSFDGTVATTIRFGTLRLVCTNGLMIAEDIVPVIKVKHRSIVNPTEVKLQLGLTGVYERFEAEADRMASTRVNERQAIEFFMQVYHDMKAEQMVDAQTDKQAKIDETIARLAQHFIASPGAELASAKGTAWGLLNAVTYDIDHVANARSFENRAYSSLLGPGEKLKQKARELALSLAA